MTSSIRQTRWQRLGIAIFWLVILNFAAFWLISMKLGGDALNGKTENGRYYLMAKGKETEVSRSVWIYSMTHTISVLIGFPLAAAGVYLSIQPGNKQGQEGFQ
jgi:ABC-type spermidine/putrescine transport system permease subunit I